ncbi:MAG: alpha/beta fold hydrolase, partial [Gemmatimonadaceae bacterium]
MTDVRPAQPGANATHELVGPRAAPVVVVLGGIAATAHVTAHAHARTPGWWDAVVGPGRAIDTTRVRVLGMNWLDAPGDGVRHAVTTHDQALAVAQVLDALGVRRVLAVVGSSYGGMVALAFGERYPSRADQLVVVSAAHESHPMTTAIRAVQRRIVRLGLARGHARESLAVARALAMTTYRSAREFQERFVPGRASCNEDGLTFDVESYLMHHGDR